MNTIPRVESTPTARSKQTWFAGIDSLRFVLAMIVVIAHCKNPIADYLKTSGIVFIQYLGFLIGISCVGIVAVIAFFVISGFVIHYPHKEGALNLRQFFIRRYTRILLPLVVVIAIGIPFGSPEESVVWSLYCELIFYALYPLIRAINMTWSTKVLIAFLLSITVILVGARFDFQSMIYQRDVNYHGEYWQLGNGLTWIVGLPCWLLGVELASRIDTVRQVISRRQIIGFTLLMFVLMVTASILRFHFFVSSIISMTLLAVPLSKWIEYEIVYYRRHRPNALLEQCGKFSYSLYLSHPLLLTILYAILPLTIPTYAVYIALIIGASYGAYWLLERPAHLLAKRLSSQKLIV